MELEPKEQYTLTVELLTNKPVMDEALMNSTTVSPMYCVSGVGDVPSDYDEVPTNYINNDRVVEINGDVKAKTRRCWTQKEEQRFFEIWGRENWRLTKHGKNTVYFAQWAEELKEKYNIDVKLEEIQCKVNQTRAKFRQVKKLMETQKSIQRWKKYDIVEKILKNQYRSKDDEPVPLEALENNRDMSPAELMNINTHSPSSTTSIHEVPSLHISQNSNQHLNDNGNFNNNLITMCSDNRISMDIFNNDPQAPGNYNRELFSEQMDIKSEIEEDLRKEEELIIDYNNVNASYPTTTSTYQNTNVESEMNNYCQTGTSVQTHGLLPVQHPQETETHTQRFQQEYVNKVLQQQQPQQQQQTRVLYPNPASHNNNHFRTSVPAHATIKAASASNASALPKSHGISGTNTASKYAINKIELVGVPTPRLTIAPPIQSRKRQGDSLQTLQSSNGIGGTIGGKVATIKTLEDEYLEEVRKKNIILQEQRDISRRRLDLEKRKLILLEEFFPKYMNVQQQILRKLDNCFTTTTNDSTNNGKAD